MNKEAVKVWNRRIENTANLIVAANLPLGALYISAGRPELTLGSFVVASFAARLSNSMLRDRQQDVSRNKNG
jgi:hypothetical protein